MTHHPRRSQVDGRRRLQLHAATAQRMAIIRDAAGPDPRDPRMVTVPTIIVQVRAQTELNARDRAQRMKGGPGNRAAMSAEARINGYVQQNRWRDAGEGGRRGVQTLTTAQKRSARRRATATETLELAGRYPLLRPGAGQ